MSAPIHRWLTEPPPEPVARALERLADLPDVWRVAVMPDVHLAFDVCIGVATATRSVLFPEAVGGDLGCGITAARFDLEAAALSRPATARDVLLGLGRRAPAFRHAVARAKTAQVLDEPLSSPALEREKRRSATVQLGTVGQGNHFIELQRDEEGRLWAMVHSGSRTLGPAIRDHHLERAERHGALRGLDATSDEGRAYLSDHAWALRYAIANRAALLAAVHETLSDVLGACEVDATFDTLHNFVRLEQHEGETVWVHRKGVISAHVGELGVVAGSMGAPSYHVEGRGLARGLCCCSHGAGRKLTRSDARRRFRARDLVAQMRGVWFDDRAASRLVDEAPLAYKDIRSVMRAQNQLIRVRRVLLPVLSYKGA